MPQWLDELEAAPEPESLQKKLAAGALVAIAVAALGYVMFGRTPEPLPPPPSTDVYRAAFPQVTAASYEGTRLALQVQAGWAGLDEGTRAEHLVGLLELTGTFEWTAIEVKDTAGLLVATVTPDGDISWHN